MNAALLPLGLYVHIPFCRQKCAYCDFYSLSNQESRMDDYVDALCAHIQKSAPLAAAYQTDTVYFGGGTPSLLGPERLSRILKTVLDTYTVAPETEITLEANPDSAGDRAALEALRAAGFNRISLGMQSACDEELREIGRVHTAEQIAAAVSAARAAGFENLSLDLIYGLPHQTMERWMDNLSAAVALQPEHLSCYGLKVEKGTPLYARQSTAQLPGDEAQADMYLAMVDYLARQGYRQYEISNFARPGKESRHNLKYWTLGAYMGFGPGAHSDFGGLRYAYDRDLESYIRSAREGVPPRSEETVISPAEREAERVMLGLRTVQGLDAAELSSSLPFLKNCEKAGYAVLENGRWHLTPQGFLVSNQIISSLLDA